MWKHKIYDLHEIGVHKKVRIDEIKSIPTSFINPIGSTISFTILETIDHGSYGDIIKAKRVSPSNTNSALVLIKQPRMVEMDLTQEAIVQHIAHKVFSSYGLSWAVPKVYDVYRNRSGVCFSMDYIQGHLASNWIIGQNTQNFYLFLAQISILLWCLEIDLNLDHRDLKADNLVIKNEPCQINIKLGGHQWLLNAPFQVIILDFGFACMGYELNLGDGVLPPMDPCPKNGRDIFHLFVSLLGIPAFSRGLPVAVSQRLDSWMSLGKKSYGDMARRWPSENWVHLVTSERKFVIEACMPETILRELLPDLPSHLSVIQ